MTPKAGVGRTEKEKKIVGKWKIAIQDYIDGGLWGSPYNTVIKLKMKCEDIYTKRWVYKDVLSELFAKK